MAELKANEARDEDTRRRCFLDAAHQWDRAAEREKPGKYRTLYEENARRNRENVEGPGDDASTIPADTGPADPARPVARRL
jgi:hypothetical protein